MNLSLDKRDLGDKNPPVPYENVRLYYKERRHQGQKYFSFKRTTDLPVPISKQEYLEGRSNGAKSRRTIYGYRDVPYYSRVDVNEGIAEATTRDTYKYFY